jgi:hypothetical protein
MSYNVLIESLCYQHAEGSEITVAHLLKENCGARKTAVTSERL